MVKIVMGKALPVEFASHAATASLAHMAFGKTSTDATAAVGGKASAAKTAGMAATAAKATTAVAAAAAPSASTAASKRIVSDACACQCQRGNEGHNLMQSKLLHHDCLSVRYDGLPEQT
jgi:hypothetical protein